MSLLASNLKSHRNFIIIYLIFIVVGLFIYADYGISWDEPISRDNNGILNVEFIKSGKTEPLLKGNEKYHGPSFEILLVYIEDLFQLKDSRDIYLMRHLVTFLSFAVSVLFFYLLCIKYLKSNWLAVIGSVFLILSPRIFADAFYNSKDLAFMAFFIINIYTAMVFLEKRNILSGIMHGLISGFVIDIRVLGVIIPCFTFLILLIDFIRIPENRKRIALASTVHLISLIGFIVLCWPVLWIKPLKHFILALQEMSHYDWDGYLRYMGQAVDAHHLPWHYIPVWLTISTPLAYILFFIAGAYFLSKKLIARINLSVFEWLNIYSFLAPLMAVIFLHSVVYDGWRHMYFVYPSFLFIALFGMKGIQNYIEQNKTVLIAFKSVVVIYCLYMSFIMFRLHPYQNIYFNSLAGSSLSEIRNKYELDYWGLSYKEGLEYILKNDTSKNIYFYSTDYPGIANLRILPANERTRLIYVTDPNIADYFLTDYRTDLEAFSKKSDFDIVRDNGAILSVWNLKSTNIFYYTQKYCVAHYETSFEKDDAQWSLQNVISDSQAFEGNHMQYVGENTLYSASFSCQVPAEFVDSLDARNYLSFKFHVKAPGSFNAYLVLEVDSQSKVCNWVSMDIQPPSNNEWNEKEIRMPLPKIYSGSDVLKIYIWNLKKKEFFVDDVELKFFSMPEEDYQSTVASKNKD